MDRQCKVKDQAGQRLDAHKERSEQVRWCAGGKVTVVNLGMAMCPAQSRKSHPPRCSILQYH
eukprot:4047254-Amphidinium_carterae.2